MCLARCLIIDFLFSDQERVCDYNMKLMDIDSEHLGIPVSHIFNIAFPYLSLVSLATLVKGFGQSCNFIIFRFYFILFLQFLADT